MAMKLVGKTWEKTPFGDAVHTEYDPQLFSRADFDKPCNWMSDLDFLEKQIRRRWRLFGLTVRKWDQ